MASSTGHRYEEALQCGVCKDTLTDPRTLPCLHMYCLKCLQGLVENGGLKDGSLDCPECRQSCPMPQQGVEGFKVSPTIIFLLDIHKESRETEEPECKICRGTHDKHTPAKIQCLDCGEKFCDVCKKMHDMLLKGHKVLDLTGDSDKDLEIALQSIKDRTVFCELHPNKPLEVYCKADKTVVCQLCYITDHNGHTAEDIKKTAEANIKQIGATLTQGQELVDIYDKAIQETLQYKTALEENAENVTAEINNDMKTLIQTISTKYKSHTEEVTKEKESNMKQVMAHLGHLELQKAIIEGQINKYKTMVDHGHPVELASLGEQVNQKSNEWSNKPEIDFKSKINIIFLEAELRDDKVHLGKLQKNETEKLGHPRELQMKGDILQQLQAKYKINTM